MTSIPSDLPKFIACHGFPASRKAWPKMLPTYRAPYGMHHDEDSHLAGFRLIVIQYPPRHDWVNGEWVRRMPEDKALYDNAAYEDVGVGTEDQMQAWIRFRRCSEMEIKPDDPCWTKLNPAPSAG